MLKYLYISLVVAFGIGLVINILTRIKKGGTTALFVKIATSMLFVLLSITAVSLKPENYAFGIFIVIGAVFGVIGDILLDLKSIHKEYDNIYLTYGMLVFSVGHIFYIIGILSTYLEFVDWQIALAIFSATAVTLIFRFISKKMKVDYGKFKALTFAYSVITMLTVTFSLNGMNAFGVLPLVDSGEMPDVMPKFVTMFVGTVLFALSDLVLSFVYFKDNEDKKISVALNYTLYYTAQFVLSLSILM